MPSVFVMRRSSAHVVFADDFNRADSASLGASWVTAARTSTATIGISSNQAVISGVADTDIVIAYPTAVVAANTPDFDVTITAGTVGDSTAPLGGFRMANPTGGFSMSYWTLLADRLVYLASGFGGGTTYGISPIIASGDVVRVRCEGTHIQVWVNGALRIDTTDPQGASDVLHGIALASFFSTTTVDAFTISTI